MRRVLLIAACAVTILSTIGCYDSKYYDIRLQKDFHGDQRIDTVRRDIRLIPYDLDLIFGLDYSSLRSDYPRPNY